MAGIADQFLADVSASAPGAPPPAAQAAPPGLAGQFLADVAAPAVAAPAKQPSQGGDPSSLLHQLGLTARAGITGVTALPAMVGDALNAGVNLASHGINSVAGTHIPDLAPVSSSIQDLQNRVGIAQPANATERVVQDAASAMAGTAPSVGIGKMLTKAASPVANAIGQGLSAMPGMQVLGQAGGGAASSGAREEGLNPAWQVGAALLGGAGGVAAGSLATSGLRSLGGMVPAAKMSPAAAAARADAGVDQAVSELGPQARQSFAPLQTAAPDPVPVGAQPATPGATPAPAANPDISALSPLKQQVAQTIMQNPDVSPAAAMRSQDFRNLGIEPTLGQITRDPMQYAQEANIRGLPVGSPIANRFNQQNSQLQQALYGLAGSPADTYSAGSAIKSSLQSIDSQMSQQVSDAYAAARASSGKNLDVPLTGVAQDYAQVLNDFGDKVPSGVRNNFNQLGLMGGTQQKTFSIENAENLLKVINANQSNDPATNAALGQLRGSVKNAILTADDQGGVYAPARALAAQRFALHEQIPALEASASDTINPDDFVKRFLVGGKTDQVSALASLLKEQAPDAFQEARNQVGGQLALKGFGQNPAGDAPFKPAGFAQQMQAFGPNKLSAFYTPDEIEQLNTIGRVGSYMNSMPAASPVNTSNTAAAVGSLVSAGIKNIPVVGKLLDNAQNRVFVNKALAAKLSDAPQQPLSPKQQRAIGALLVAPPTNRGNP